MGRVSGVSAGDVFPSRKSLVEAQLHRFTQQGISWNGTNGADAIVLSGGYTDDEDLGDEIIYTGEGGRDALTGRQVKDQQMIRGNAGLNHAYQLGQPVRVIRGANHRSEYAPESGYQYGGLYRIDDVWSAASVNGPRVIRYRLVRVDNDPWSPYERLLRDRLDEADVVLSPPERREGYVSRVIRNTAVTLEVKSMYGGHCQLCMETVDTPAGPYSEGAHIQPLGRPHHGLDHVPNVLCLCPNDHVSLDRGAVFIDDDLVVRDMDGAHVGRVDRRDRHEIDMDAVEYHRDHIFGVGL